LCGEFHFRINSLSISDFRIPEVGFGQRRHGTHDEFATIRKDSPKRLALQLAPLSG
jgi:hypothetical protein